MKGIGIEAMREVVQLSATDDASEAPAVVLPCSCGHVFTARDR
jgi:hypothetical protein